MNPAFNKFPHSIMIVGATLLSCLLAVSCFRSNSKNKKKPFDEDARACQSDDGCESEQAPPPPPPGSSGDDDDGWEKDEDPSIPQYDYADINARKFAGLKKQKWILTKEQQVCLQAAKIEEDCSTSSHGNCCTNDIECRNRCHVVNVGNKPLCEWKCTSPIGEDSCTDDFDIGANQTPKKVCQTLVRFQAKFIDSYLPIAKDTRTNADYSGWNNFVDAARTGPVLQDKNHTDCQAKVQGLTCTSETEENICRKRCVGDYSGTCFWGRKNGDPGAASRSCWAGGFVKADERYKTTSQASSEERQLANQDPTHTNIFKKSPQVGTFKNMSAYQPNFRVSRLTREEFIMGINYLPIGHRLKTGPNPPVNKTAVVSLFGDRPHRDAQGWLPALSEAPDMEAFSAPKSYEKIFSRIQMTKYVLQQACTRMHSGATMMPDAIDTAWCELSSGQKKATSISEIQFGTEGAIMDDFFEKLNLVIWRPIPTPGYRCLGDIVSTNFRVPYSASDNFPELNAAEIDGEAVQCIKEEYLSRATTAVVPIIESTALNLQIREIQPEQPCKKKSTGDLQTSCAKHKTATSCYAKQSEKCSWGRIDSLNEDQCFHCGKRNDSGSPKGLYAGTFVARLTGSAYHGICSGNTTEESCTNDLIDGKNLCYWGRNPDQRHSSNSQGSVGCFRHEPDIFVIKSENIKMLP